MFRRVDPMDADAELADPDAVPVGNGGDAGDFVRRSNCDTGGERGQDDGEERDQTYLHHRRVPSGGGLGRSPGELPAGCIPAPCRLYASEVGAMHSGSSWRGLLTRVLTG